VHAIPDLKYVIWDFDGTLAYRDGAWSGTLAGVLRGEVPGSNASVADFRPYMQAGFPWHQPERAHGSKNRDDWWEALTPVFAHAFRCVGGQTEDEALRLARAVRRHYLDPAHWHLFDDTLPCLDNLRAQGWRHVVLSNHVPELPELIAALGLSPYIDRVFNSADTGYEKPHPEAFRNVIGSLGTCAKICMVGDNLQADIEGAQAAGLRAILVRSRHPGSGVCCDGLADLPGLLDGAIRLPW
jgi:putative hydrolase of the HAD superfamily